MFLTTAFLLLMGCSSKEKIAGQREPVLEVGFKDNSMIKDYYPVIVDPVTFNSTCTQPCYTQSHAYAPLMLEPTENFSSILNVSLDYPSSTRTKMLAAPIIAEGKVFLVDAGGIVYALDQKSGQRLWRASATLEGKEGQLGCATAYHNGKFIVSSSFGEALAFDAKDGKVLWRVKLAAVCRGEGITIYKDRAYLLCSDSSLQVLSLDDGHLLWSHMGVMPDSAFIGSAAVAISDNIIYAAYPSGEVYALDANGKVLWDLMLSKYSVTDASYAMIHPRACPVVYKNLVYFVTANHQITALDKHTGKKIWEKNLGGTSTPLVTGNSVFLFNAPNEVVCLNFKTGALKWQTQLENTVESLERYGLILVKDYVLAVSPLGKIYFISISDGKVKKVVNTDRQVTVNPVVADGALYLLSDDAELNVYK